jgi:hypothetical protein
MITVWLKYNWKEILEETPVVVIEVSGGTVSDYESPENIRVTIIDHDVLEMEIFDILNEYYSDDDVAEKLTDMHYDQIISIMRETGDTDVESIVKDVMDLD